MPKLLEIKDLHINFRVYAGKVKAIRGVSFDINENEIVALVGESGSGKSVLAKSIIGLLPKVNTIIDQGEIILNKQDLTKLNEKEMQKIRGKEVAMIFQDPMTSLNPVLKVGYQIQEAILLHQEVDKKEAKKIALELIEAVGIHNNEIIYNQFPHQLSGGMRQRIVIAIALACKAKLLICDEPTTALDVTTQAQIIDLIKELKQKYKLAVLFITHDLGVVANIADRVIVLYAGKICEIGTARDIFYNPLHPYTWGLLSSIPNMNSDTNTQLYCIPGTPPNLLNPPVGDAFALRSEYALEIDFEKEAPFFKVDSHHYVASWLLHEYAPKVIPPESIKIRNRHF